MTLRFDSFLILSFVSDYIGILLPVPFTAVNPNDLSVLTQLQQYYNTALHISQSVARPAIYALYFLTCYD